MIRYSHMSAGDYERRGGLTAHWLTGKSEPQGAVELFQLAEQQERLERNFIFWPSFEGKCQV